MFERFTFVVQVAALLWWTQLKYYGYKRRRTRNRRIYEEVKVEKSIRYPFINRKMFSEIIDRIEKEKR